MTKVCVPTTGGGGLDALVDEHFGRAPTYTILDTATDTVEVAENTSEHMGGTGLPAELLTTLGIDVLLCSGLGGRAIQMLSEAGIEVYTGFTGTVGEAVVTWRTGGLKAADDSDRCTQHAFHDHG